MTNPRIPASGRLGIGDACRLFGFTPRALRLYDEWGLVRAQRDGLNRRYYVAADRERLAWIAKLRRARLSLPCIRRVLAADARNGRGADLAREMLEARLADLIDQLTQVKAEIALLSGHPPTREPAVALRRAG
jgi:DNA-binding transcriptional MerR regulator